MVDQNNEDERYHYGYDKRNISYSESNGNQPQDNDLNEKSEPANADDTQPMELTQTFETVTRSILRSQYSRKLPKNKSRRWGRTTGFRKDGDKRTREKNEY